MQSTKGPLPLALPSARRIWLAAQRLDAPAPFGTGPEATRAAVEHLGYIQIDTINVIERCHHHILFSRIPDYRREDLRQAQAVDKSVFEYWTHALSYVPTRDFHFYVDAMRRHRKTPDAWFGSVTPADLRKVMRRLRDEGPLSIRDIDDDVLVDKHHPWASRKPSKRALQFAFYMGRVAIAERTGMLKTYDLIERHFGWEALPKPASARDTAAYLLERAVRAQGIVSLDSICYGDVTWKPAVRKLIEGRVRRRELVPVAIEGTGKQEHWATPEAIEATPEPEDGLVHILSPFDPLIIQRKRLALFFGYDHVFEAYVPKAKRKYGYFALPILMGDRIAAALDLKTDRTAGRLLIQQWTWIGDSESRAAKRRIEEALQRFERFQLAP
ncbi:MAG: YcaQ family DNA glycosylase [Bauldia sp.]|nr:YcaQ family DNA glycosylase [Bauldia sp.]